MQGAPSPQAAIHRGTSPLTSESRSHGGLLFGLVADPLLAALPRELHPARVGAVRAGQADIHAAEGHTAHRPVQAGALVLAAALEGLAAPVHHTAEDTRGSIPSCEGQEAEGEAGGREVQRGRAAAPASPFPCPAAPRPCALPPPPAGGSSGPHSPVQTPILRLAGEPKSQKSPLWWSQGSRSVQSSPSCLAQTRQQPQPSSTRETPAGQVGPGPAPHWHCPLHSWPCASCERPGRDRERGGRGVRQGRRRDRTVRGQGWRRHRGRRHLPG